METNGTMPPEFKDEENELYWSESDPKALELSYYPNLNAVNTYLSYGPLAVFAILIGWDLLCFVFSLGKNTGEILKVVLCNLLLALPFYAYSWFAKQALKYRKPNAVFMCKSIFYYTIIWWIIDFVTSCMFGKFQGLLYVAGVLVSVMYCITGLQELGQDDFDEVFPDEYRKVKIEDLLMLLVFIIFPYIVVTVMFTLILY